MKNVEILYHALDFHNGLFGIDSKNLQKRSPSLLVFTREFYKNLFSDQLKSIDSLDENIFPEAVGDDIRSFFAQVDIQGYEKNHENLSETHKQKLETFMELVNTLTEEEFANHNEVLKKQSKKLKVTEAPESIMLFILVVRDFLKQFKNIQDESVREAQQARDEEISAIFRNLEYLDGYGNRASGRR